VTLRSQGQVAILSDSSIYTHVYAKADGGGIGAGSNAKAYSTVDSDSAGGHGTATSIGDGAHIDADTVRLNAQVSKLSTYAHSRALAGGFVAVAISDSNIDTDSTVTAFIDTDVRIAATRGVDIGAFHRNASASRGTTAIPIAFIPTDRAGQTPNRPTVRPGWEQNRAGPTAKVRADGAIDATRLGGYEHLASSWRRRDAIRCVEQTADQTRSSFGRRAPNRDRARTSRRIGPV